MWKTNICQPLHLFVVLRPSIALKINEPARRGSSAILIQSHESVSCHGFSGEADCDFPDPPPSGGWNHQDFQEECPAVEEEAVSELPHGE